MTAVDDAEPPASLTVGDTEYTYLGTDAEQGYHHYYRYEPEYAGLVYIDDPADPDIADRWLLDNGDPMHILQEYRYHQLWEAVRELEDHDYRNLPDPSYRPALNEGLGGSILLDDGDYVVPFRAPIGTVADVLTEAADDGDVVVDYRPQFIELAPADAMQKYQLTTSLRGDTEITGDRIVDEVVILDRGSEEAYDRFHVDALARDHYVDQLATLDGIDEPLAEDLIEEYGNLRTVSWATTSDTDYLEDTFDVDAHHLFEVLGSAGVYRNENSPESGVLQFPERRADELSEPKQERYFDEVVAPQSDDDTESEDDAVQTGFDDFA